MDSEKYEVVVVGAGPAGSAAAYTLAAGGRRVCLVDKAEFPREKLCGGLITLRSRRTFESVFGPQWNSDLFNHSDEVLFYANGKYLATQSHYSTLYFTMRVDFDNYLLNLARKAGSNVKLGETVELVDRSRNAIILKTGGVIEYDFLIGADGVNSVVARSLYGQSFNQSTIGFGLETEIPRTALANHAEAVEIEFGAARWGYGWVFPKKKTYTVGVGGLHELNPDLRERMIQYLIRKKLNPADYKIKGQYIPFGDFRVVPGGGNLFLSGDAAGTVDPITGEGIAYAMQTGADAARAILDALREGKPDSAFRNYRHSFESVAGSLQQAKLWRNLIFPPAIQRGFEWAFADAGTLQRGYLDILAGDRDYNSLYGLFAVQIGKAVRKPFRLLLEKATKGVSRK